MNHVEQEAARQTTESAAGPAGAAPPAEPTVGQLQEQLAQAQTQAAEYLDQWRRSTAELSNARKRLAREQEELRSTAAARVLEKLVPVVDDVERAFAALPANKTAGDWIEGFRLIQRKLQALLESEGVTAIPAAGQAFDPSLHYAVTHEPSAEFADGQIIAEVARGYRLGGRVLRPSMVRVAKANG
ncbi:MAG: nucleotide exchange factor GrpE [Chloroflexi bacterium]|nr:nucleotide exchange factor GrpE [Chloroflexota bacterium]